MAVSRELPLSFDFTHLVRRVADELGRVDRTDDNAVVALAQRLDKELRPPRRLPRRRNPVDAYTVDDLLERAPISRTAIYSEFKSGRLPARKRAGRIYVLAEDFREWLASAPPAFAGTGAKAIAARRSGSAKRVCAVNDTTDGEKPAPLSETEAPNG